MFKTLPFATLLVASMLLAASAAPAQWTPSLGNSRASAGGYTANALRSIYREDIGTGYTSQSLNAISLQNAQARVGYFGQSSAGMGTRSSSASSTPVSSL